MGASTRCIIWLCKGWKATFVWRNRIFAAAAAAAAAALLLLLLSLVYQKELCQPLYAGYICIKESYICCCCCGTTAAAVSGLSKRIVAASISLYANNNLSGTSQLMWSVVTTNCHGLWPSKLASVSVCRWWSSGSSKDIFAGSLSSHNLMVDPWGHIKISYQTFMQA